MRAASCADVTPPWASSHRRVPGSRSRFPAAPPTESATLRRYAEHQVGPAATEHPQFCSARLTSWEGRAQSHGAARARPSGWAGRPVEIHASRRRSWTRSLIRPRSAPCWRARRRRPRWPRTSAPAARWPPAPAPAPAPATWTRSRARAPPSRRWAAGRRARPRSPRWPSSGSGPPWRSGRWRSCRAARRAALGLAPPGSRAPLTPLAASWRERRWRAGAPAREAGAGRQHLLLTFDNEGMATSWVGRSPCGEGQALRRRTALAVTRGRA